MDRIPILRMGEYLLVTIQVDMHDQLALQLQEDLTRRISEESAAGVLIDDELLEILSATEEQVFGTPYAYRVLVYAPLAQKN